jgi:PucR C-terminal helix-turn-helix domain
MAAPLPPQAADALRPELPRLADDIIAAIAADVPGYARPMEGRFGQVVRFGVEVALNRFVDILEGEGAGEASARETYVRLGAGEFRAGRSLDALLAAYRVGARLAWRRFVEAGRGAGFSPDALYDLGEAIFAYIDEISAESAEGYAEAQSEAAGESQRRRQGLLRLLVQEPPAPADAVRNAAQAAGWALPRRVAVVVAAESDQPEGLAAAQDHTGSGQQVADGIAARLARRLGPGALGASVGGLAVVLLPDPEGPGRRRTLEVALDGELAAIGPAVAWTEAGASLRRAAAAFRLAAQGRLDGQVPRSPGGQTGPSPGGQSGARLVVADEHLPALLLAAEPGLAAELARSRLAPLDALGPGPRERLAATLRAWLDRPGQVQAVAAALSVHPQTVRYRLKQVREL